MKTDAELKVLINDRFKSMDGREAGLNNDTLEAVFSFWKNNLGSELTLRRDTTHTTNQDPQIVIGFNVTKSGDSFSVSTPAKSWVSYQWASAGGYYHFVYEYTDQTPPTFTCNAAYDNIGTYFDNAYTTIAKALAAERNLFGRMADAIRYVNDSSSTINGQDIPNEIRALKEISPVVKTYDNLTDYLTDIGQILLPNEDRSGHYLGPDGNYYKYSCTLVNPGTGGNYTFKFYANYRFCVSKESKSTSWVAPDNMYLLSGATGTGGVGNVVAFSFGTDQYTNDCSAGAVLIGQSMTLPPIKGTANNGTFPFSWSANISEAEANSYGIPVFNTNQEALAYVAQADPPAYINAQDFPQAIRDLDPRYLAPNGQKYNYKTSAYISSGGGTYNFYTDYPLFVCSDRMTSGKYYLESFLINIDNVDTIVEVSTFMGSYDANVTRIYPTGTYGGYSKRPCISYGQNEATCPYNWGINLSSQEVSDAGLTIYTTVKDAYAAITGKYVGPDGNLYEYKYTYYATFTHTTGTAGADIWADYKLGATPSITNNCVVYWNEQNYMAGAMYGIPDCNSGTNKEISNTHKNDYYVQTGSLSNQSMAIATPGVYPYATLTTNIPSFSTRGELIAYLTDRYVLATVDSTYYTGYELNVRSSYPFFFITSTPSSRTDVYTAIKGSDNNIYLCRLYLVSNVHYWQPDVKYPTLPSGVTFTNDYYETATGGVMTTSNRVLGGTSTNYTTLQVFTDYESAYAYIMNL